MVRILSLVLILTLPNQGFPAALVLSQKDVAELFLRQAPKVKEINLKYQQISAPKSLAESAYDWKLILDSGYEYDKTESFSIIGNAKFERLKTNMSLQKPIATTGTVMGLDLTRFSQKADVSSLGSSASSATPGQANLDTLVFSVEQPLWYNSFGYMDRATLRKAQADYESQMAGRLNELEDSVLEIIRAYWTTFVAAENFKESIASKERYEKLVASVRRKNSVGYANPGELSQVEAEYEGRVQIVKTNSVEYLKQHDSFVTALGLPAQTQIEFKVDSSLPTVPTLRATEIAGLRTIKTQQLKTQSAEEAKLATESKNHPALNFIAKVGATGFEQSAEASLTELTGNSHPKYYAGFKFLYTFGSGSSSDDTFAKRANALAEEIKLQRLFKEESDRAALAERKVGAAFSIAESAAKQKAFREKAVQELNRSFTQGRTDISVLIDAMNKHYASQIQAAKALGDYQIALNEWAALRDELIPETSEAK